MKRSIKVPLIPPLSLIISAIGRGRWEDIVIRVDW